MATLTPKPVETPKKPLKEVIRIWLDECIESAPPADRCHLATHLFNQVGRLEELLK